MPRSYPIASILLACNLLAACGESPTANETQEHAAPAATEYERGPHRGRMLRDGDFAVEMTIFEDGVEPEFRVYAYRNDKPVAPAQVQLSVALNRRGRRVDRLRSEEHKSELQSLMRISYAVFCLN